MTREKTNEDVTYEVHEKIGVIASYSNGWSKEINKISWNGRSGKFDIRDWDDKHEHMSRGITLHEDEMLNLFHILSEYFQPASSGAMEA